MGKEIMNKKELDERIRKLYCIEAFPNVINCGTCTRKKFCEKETQKIIQVCAKYYASIFLERIEGLPARKGIEEKGGWQRTDLISFVDIKKVFDSTTQDKK